MRKIILILSVFMILTSGLFAQKTTVKEAFLEKWENSKNYLIGIAEAMPEEEYNFKPTERQMSFNEQLVHIKGNMDWLSSTYFSQLISKKENVLNISNKQVLISQLTESFNATYNTIEATPDDELEETVTFFAGQKSKLQILNLLQDHVTHHRGQLIVYLNLKNIEPPKYVGW
jgi:uncharacterized damage-inducible protein DinB